MTSSSMEIPIVTVEAAVEAYAINGTGNQIAAIGGLWVWNDAAGRITQRWRDGELQGYLYGLDGRLAAVTEDGAEVAAYQHNAFGERVIATYAAGTVHIHYGLAGRRLAESEDDGDLVRGWVWLNGQPVVQFTPDGQGGHTLRYIATDQLGQPLMLIADDSGPTVVWHRVAMPFSITYAMEVGTEADEPTRLPGQYQDPVTGLYYNYQRDFDPDLGRYLTPDPIGLDGGDVNLYAYVLNSPLRWTDFFGLETYVVGVGGSGALMIGAEGSLTHLVDCYLKSYRKRTGLLQRDVALLLGFSTAANISRYERGARLPHLEAALYLELVFDARIVDLFPPVVAELDATLAGRAEALLAGLQEGPPERLEHLARIAARSRP